MLACAPENLLMHCKFVPKVFKEIFYSDLKGY